MKKGRRNEKGAEAKSALLHTYFTSLISLLLCVTMFFGTSYAWFTSEVTNTGNEIYIGTLDVELEKLVNGGWVSLSEMAGNTNKTPLFDRDIRWEPGCTAVETVRIVDEGDLAFAYALKFTQSGELVNPALQNAAEWFEVWYCRGTEGTVPAVSSFEQITAANSGWIRAGSLEELLNGRSVFSGKMDSEEVVNKQAVHTYSIALHMNGVDADAAQKEALDALMGQKISLNVTLTATQLTGEQNTFYNLESIADTLVYVKAETGSQKVPFTQGENTEITLDQVYRFTTLKSATEAEKAPYKNYHADFVVRSDKPVAGGTVALAGYCKGLNTGNEDAWVVLTTPGDITAGTEIRLVQTMTRGMLSVSYAELCGFEGDGFLCGAADISADQQNAGTTITVELRLYETEGSSNVETGRYVTLGTYTYTFPG